MLPKVAKSCKKMQTLKRVTDVRTDGRTGGLLELLSQLKTESTKHDSRLVDALAEKRKEMLIKTEKDVEVEIIK